MVALIFGEVALSSSFLTFSVCTLLAISLYSHLSFSSFYDISLQTLLSMGLRYETQCSGEHVCTLQSPVTLP